MVLWMQAWQPGFLAPLCRAWSWPQTGIVVNHCQYGVLYVGSYYNTGPYINFPNFGNSNLGKLPDVHPTEGLGVSRFRGFRGLGCRSLGA